MLTNPIRCWLIPSLIDWNPQLRSSLFPQLEPHYGYVVFPSCHNRKRCISWKHLPFIAYAHHHYSGIHAMNNHKFNDQLDQFVNVFLVNHWYRSVVKCVEVYCIDKIEKRKEEWLDREEMGHPRRKGCADGWVGWKSGPFKLVAGDPPRGNRSGPPF